MELARWWPRSWLKVTPWYPDQTEDRGKSENLNNEIILDIDKKMRMFTSRKPNPLIPL